MNFLGDYVALGITAILGLFHFVNNPIRTKAGKHFSFSLVFAALTAVTDIICGVFSGFDGAFRTEFILLKTLYFTLNMISIVFIAMVFVLKIIEHSHHGVSVLKRARAVLTAVFAVYFAMLVFNIFDGMMFFADENGYYVKGAFSFIGYVAIGILMAAVAVCYIKNRRTATKAVKNSVVHIFVVAVFCIILHQMFPGVHLNALMLSLANMVMFLDFRSNLPGVHTITNLNDRHSLFSFIESSVSLDKKFTAFIIYIKNFDVIAAKYGHKTGDEIIYRFAFALEKLLDESTTFCLEDMCFAVLVPGNESHEAIARKITDFVEKEVDLDEESIKLDCIVIEKNEFSGDFGYKNANVIYEEFKYAVDYAKATGKKYFVFTHEMSEQILRRRYITGKLKNVDAEHGFEVYFQPVHCRASDRFCSMEALMRLKEPDGTFISPAEFIPIAEQTGMISSVTWFAVEESCRAISQNEVLKNVNVSINFPMEQLFHADFLPRLNEITAKYGINHNQVCLEFTERVMMENFSKAKEYMERITAEGYRFFLDDFGTGFSNFSCLLQLPFDTVKIDSSLTLAEKNNINERNIVSVLTELFHSMGLKVVAEGVETEKEVELLGGMQIDRLQGYYFSRPIPVNEVVEFYKKNPLEE